MITIICVASRCFIKTAFVLLLIVFYVPSFCQIRINIEDQELYDKNRNSAKQAYDADNPYCIVLMNENIQGHLKIIRQLNERLAIVKVQNKNEFEALKKQEKIEVANFNWKFSPDFESSFIGKKKDGIFSYIISGEDMESLKDDLTLGSKNLEVLDINKATNSFVIKCKSSYLINVLLPLSSIIYVDKFLQPKTEIGIIGYNKSFHGNNILDDEIPMANGKNIVVGIKENKMEASDLDLIKRVLPSVLASDKVEYHATVISSLIGGAGNSFYDGRGVANACTFYSSSFSNLFADDALILNQNKISIQNHSYGTIPQQFYGAEALSYDLHTWQNQNFIHVFSAGNSGLTAPSEGKYMQIPFFANITGNFKMAKNIITIAAISRDGIVPPASSAGPLYDGRLAPHLTAYGPNGTSDAAALVSGTVAVMQQVYADSNNQQLPPASLVKAILFNTADDIYVAGIDYKTGYGLLNSYEAVKTIQQKLFIESQVSPNQTWSKNILIPPGTAQLKITLAWTDTPASLNNNRAISNDLDLEVKDLASELVFKPWVLNDFPNSDSLSALPKRKRDSINTSEQVILSFPHEGLYEIKVKGTKIISVAIPFSVAYRIDTLYKFKFTNPQSAVDINREENESIKIKWRVFVPDTNLAGSLSISYNGLDWELLKEDIHLHIQEYNWQIKDTNSMIKFKMTTPFGTFLSKNVILSNVCKIKVEFNCTDSFQLSWPKHLYADSYQIYALSDAPYLQKKQLVLDTFKTFRKSDYSTSVFAVEPILNNQLPAIRSIAVNIEAQGVKCFYKSFYYNILNGNNLDLFLELSTTTNLDSLFFEQVTDQGQSIKLIGALKIGSNLMYMQTVNNLSQGTSYYRAKLKLKNKEIMYTEVISVLTSGSKQIVFYPNPVHRGDPVNYVLLQGIPVNSKLQLFDLAGHLIKILPAFTGNMDISQFPSGVLFYKLVSEDSKNILDSGRIIIL